MKRPAGSRTLTNAPWTDFVCFFRGNDADSQDLLCYQTAVYWIGGTKLSQVCECVGMVLWMLLTAILRASGCVIQDNTITQKRRQMSKWR